MLREAQARETRRLLVGAAADLFVREGYGATTIDAVAAAAGVSRKTVFTAVGGKLELLALALDWAIAGDDEPVALADRAEIASLFERDDATGILGDWLRLQVAIDVRIAGLFEALTVAAGLDPAARELLHDLQGRRRSGTGKLAAHLARTGPLRPGVSTTEAADLIWLASDPVLYSRLVTRQGWSRKRFEGWLVRTTTEQVLGG